MCEYCRYEGEGNGFTEDQAQPPVKTLKAPPAFQKAEEPGRFKKATGKVNRSNIPATAFSVADLQAATNSFSQENLLGEGAMGCVYRADMPDGQVSTPSPKPPPKLPPSSMAKAENTSGTSSQQFARGDNQLLKHMNQKQLNKA